MVLCTQCQKLAVEARVPDCNILGGGGCLASNEDMQLQQKIQELQGRRRKLRTTMNANHDPFVLKLPPEVASHIFLLSMGERDTREVSGDGLPTPFLLGAVCRGWRHLARSTPHLWSRLAFVLPKSKKSTIMKSLPHLVTDWLERSGGLPLTLDISYRGPRDSPPEVGSVPVINALNQHSGRWKKVKFHLPSFYLDRLSGTSPPKSLCNIFISNWWGTVRNPTFKMNTRPSPMEFIVIYIPLKAVDIAWDRLVHLAVNAIPLDGVLQVIRDAPLLEICSLSEISTPIDVSETIFVRHPHLRTLILSWMQAGVFTKVINSLELPSLESWTFGSEENVIAVEAISFLKRSGSGLKKLDISQDQVPAFEDFERLLQAAPHLQCLVVDSPIDDFSSVMDNILERISVSPPSALQIGNHAGFLSGLQCLKLSGRELNVWECIPLIYQWAHRKILKLDIQMECIKIGDEMSGILVQLADEGIDLSICDPNTKEDYLQRFRDSTSL
jgi:hypothetical protein